MIATRPAEQIMRGDVLHGISVLKVIHRGVVQHMPYRSTSPGKILVPITCEVHGDEELEVAYNTLANVERNR